MSPSRVVDRILGLRLLFSDTFFTSFLGLRAPLRPKGLLLGILRKSCNIPGSNLEHLGPSLGGLWGSFGSYVGHWGGAFEGMFLMLSLLWSQAFI